MEVPRFAAVGLSLMLAVNCFMPCYTLAYADESQEVADVPEEEQKKSLVTQEDLNSRLVASNQTLMQQMEEQQQRDMALTMEQQQEQGKILRQLMRSE